MIFAALVTILAASSDVAQAAGSTRLAAEKPCGALCTAQGALNRLADFSILPMAYAAAEDTIGAAADEVRVKAGETGEAALKTGKITAEKAQDKASDAAEGAADIGQAAKDSAAKTASKAADKAADLKADAKASASKAADKAADVGADAKASASKTASKAADEASDFKEAVKDTAAKAASKVEDGAADMKDTVKASASAMNDMVKEAVSEFQKRQAEAVKKAKDAANPEPEPTYADKAKEYYDRAYAAVEDVMRRMMKSTDGAAYKAADKVEDGAQKVKQEL